MNRTTRATLALAALGLALSGCTGSSGEDPKPQATPQEKWAQSLCEALEPTTAAVSPPATDGAATPAESKKEIVKFLRTLRDRLDSQAQVLDEAGAPPEVDAAAYEKAKKSVADGSQTLQGVIKRLKKADPKNADQMQATLLQVGESLAESSSYQGPLAELSASNAELKKAFESDKTCSSIMS
ncbi:hypothetical protein GL325_04285 [Aeromicrobium sp. 636]|uniref:Small secreted protein n=1 Tax=Aeromicrobium senzhongii TaxID=2663859 RepID=A0A8I0EUF1_9ACTN|nr:MULTISPECIES: hypothetical protein [Aeromicrobium]MBC9225536.1 hypothetical protein [Aeromicrobium senzhongii]MCQ3997646.1 hypothetical protein [Aeromicrobium sp. 636]